MDKGTGTPCSLAVVSALIHFVGFDRGENDLDGKD
jgi:hypothetical protein